MTPATPRPDLSALVDELGGSPQTLTTSRDPGPLQRDTWTWISECVTTVDELDPQTPIKPFPVAACVACRRYLGHAQRTRCPQCGGPPSPLAYLASSRDSGNRRRPPCSSCRRPGGCG